VTLPAKFPLVLLDGADGIAVGLSTKILPHNFNDLCRAAINHLQGKRFRIMPDFPTGGIADFSEYNDGERGGKVKVRAKIEQRSKYLLAITELPYGTTTESLIESILAANAKGKIKIKHVDDNTAEKVEILVHLPQGSDPDQVIQQLYVFTDCQVSLSPAACVIDTTGQDGRFLGVSEISATRRSTRPRRCSSRSSRSGSANSSSSGTGTRSSASSSRSASTAGSRNPRPGKACWRRSAAGLKPFLKQLRREVTDDDITRLTEIRIKRISAYNRFKADEQIKKIEAEIKETKHEPEAPHAYAIAWFEMLQEKYGKGLKRRTTYDEIEQINAARSSSANQRLYVNREEGFIGLNWRQHEFVRSARSSTTSLCIMGDGTLKVSRVATRFSWAATSLYQDKESGKCFAKRFTVGGVTRDKLYSIVASEGSEIVFFDVAQTEAAMPETVKVTLSGRCSARVKEFEFDLSELTVSSRGSKGVTVTKYPVRKVVRA
jgi:topoisomerase IV subunit A